jgi:hypothetical protein
MRHIAQIRRNTYRKRHRPARMELERQSGMAARRAMHRGAPGRRDGATLGACVSLAAQATVTADFGSEGLVDR